MVSTNLINPIISQFKDMLPNVNPFSKGKLGDKIVTKLPPLNLPKDGVKSGSDFGFQGDFGFVGIIFAGMTVLGVIALAVVIGVIGLAILL